MHTRNRLYLQGNINWPVKGNSFGVIILIITLKKAKNKILPKFGGFER